MAPTVGDVLAALETATEELPRFELVVVDRLPDDAAAVTTQGRVYLAAGLAAESAGQVLVDVVAHLLIAERGEHRLHWVPQQRGPIDSEPPSRGRAVPEGGR